MQILISLLATLQFAIPAHAEKSLDPIPSGPIVRTIQPVAHSPVGDIYRVANFPIAAARTRLTVLNRVYAPNATKNGSDAYLVACSAGKCVSTELPFGEGFSEAKIDLVKKTLIVFGSNTSDGDDGDRRSEKSSRKFTYSIAEGGRLRVEPWDPKPPPKLLPVPLDIINVRDVGPDRIVLEHETATGIACSLVEKGDGVVTDDTTFERAIAFDRLISVKFERGVYLFVGTRNGKEVRLRAQVIQEKNKPALRVQELRPV